MRAALVTAGVLLATALAAPARADDSVLAEAKAHFQKGREAYQAASYDVAIREFEAAQALKASPLLTYNIGLAYEQHGDVRHAVENYRRYLEEKPDARNRSEVEERIAALEPTASEPPKSEPPKTEPPKSETPKGEAPRPRVIQCPAGQLVTEDTADHCCWPGQVWSKRRLSCAGIPQCPAGFQQNGERCVRANASVLPPLDIDPWAAPAIGPGLPSLQVPEGTVPVSFSSKRGSDYTYGVTAGKQYCTTPCSMFLKPGKVKLSISGAAVYQAQVTVPQNPAILVVEHRRWRTFVGGAVLVGLGTAAAIAGTVLVAPGPNSLNPPDEFGNQTVKDGGNAVPFAIGVVCFAASAVFLPIGIPMMSSLDEDRVHVRGARAAADTPPPGTRSLAVRLTGFGVAPSGSGATAGLRFAF